MLLVESPGELPCRILEAFELQSVVALEEPSVEVGICRDSRRWAPLRETMEGWSGPAFERPKHEGRHVLLKVRESSSGPMSMRVASEQPVLSSRVTPAGFYSPLHDRHVPMRFYHAEGVEIPEIVRVPIEEVR